jgi:hypothetical protein
MSRIVVKMVRRSTTKTGARAQWSRFPTVDEVRQVRPLPGETM